MGQRGPIAGEKAVAAPAGRPKAPRELGAAARAEWKRVCLEMEAVGTLASTDRAALIEYCLAFEQKRQIERELEAQGWTFMTGAGQIKQNPLANLLLRLAGLIQQYLDRFGLTPAGRMRVAASQGKPKRDALEDF